VFDSTDFVDSPQPVERRHHHRQRTLLSGRLLFRHNNLTGDCAIRNLSELGAKLRGDNVVTLPDNPMVIVTKTGLAHEALTIWRDADEIGVKFANTHDLRRDGPGALTRAYQLWLESIQR